MAMSPQTVASSVVPRARQVAAKKRRFAGRGLCSKPVAAVSHPPTRIRDRNGSEHSPPEGQHQIRHQAQPSESEPKYLLLHDYILAAILSPLAVSTKAIPELHLPSRLCSPAS